MSQHEVYTLLKATPGRMWNSKELGKQLGLSPKLVGEQASTLARFKFGITRERQAGTRRTYVWYYGKRKEVWER